MNMFDGYIIPGNAKEYEDETLKLQEVIKKMIGEACLNELKKSINYEKSFSWNFVRNQMTNRVILLIFRLSRRE